MSLNDFFDSLLTKTTTKEEGEDIFRQYVNLDEYDYNYSDPHPTDQPPPLVAPSDPLPPIVHPTATSSKVYSSTSLPGRSVAAPFISIAPSTPPVTAMTETLPVLNYIPTENSTCEFRALRRVCLPAQDCLNDSAPLARASICPSSDVPRATGLGTTSTYWNTRAAAYSGGHGTVDVGAPCLGGHAWTATGSSVTHISASATNPTEKLETAIGITVAQKDHPALVTQFQREAEDFIARYGNLFEDPDTTCPGPLQPHTKTLVQRITKAGDHNAASLPYPRAHPRSKRPRVPGCFVCTWEGCNESFARNDRLERHVESRHIRSKDHRCKYCEYACSRRDNLQAHMRNCKSRPGQL